MDTSTIGHLADRAVERTVAGRRAEYGAEMRRIVDATFALVERTGSLEPSMREILAEAGLSTQGFYRYFASKDELMLALLDEGSRRLVAGLQRRMQRSRTPAAQVRAWIDGVLAQTADPSAAARTRPWALSEQRLAELFPEAHQASVDVLVGLLVDPVRRLTGTGSRAGDARTAATLVYRLTFATLRAHLAAGSSPAAAELDALTRFCLRGLRP